MSLRAAIFLWQRATTEVVSLHQLCDGFIARPPIRFLLAYQSLDLLGDQLADRGGPLGSQDPRLAYRLDIQLDRQVLLRSHDTILHKSHGDHVLHVEFVAAGSAQRAASASLWGANRTCRTQDLVDENGIAPTGAFFD
jgi:hypothetical protein